MFLLVYSYHLLWLWTCPESNRVLYGGPFGFTVDRNHSQALKMHEAGLEPARQDLITFIGFRFLRTCLRPNVPYRLPISPLVR